MCGICGVVLQDRSRSFDRHEFRQMRDSIEHRGPDDAGEYLAPGIALGTRRLAILDLSERGHMPMSTPDGRYFLTYNGEVYNCRELAADLSAQGVQFRSETDTEVVLELYAREGPAMLDKLNGMFAFAIWDSLERTLFIARDRLGVKPLYYVQRGGDLLFASEAKALFAAGVDVEFDRDTLPEILSFRFVAGSRSPFRGVQRLLPGHFMIWKDGRTSIQRWWKLADRAKGRRAEVGRDPVGWFRETFDRSVALRRLSDVPVGVLLSGGLDSGSVAASLGLQGLTGLASFTVSFSETGYDESRLAAEVAEQYGLECHRLTVTPETLVELLPEASFLNDEPLVHGNDVHLFALSRYAKPRVTVLLSGEGGDETLGGYIRYRPLRYPRLLPLLAGGKASRTAGRLQKLRRLARLGSADRWVLFNACDVFPADLERLGLALDTESLEYRLQILAEAQEAWPKDLVRQAMYSDQHTFLCSILDRNDRMTMGASIECRVPFLDYRLVEGLAALPSTVLLRGFQTKGLLRRALGARLPANVRRHRKWGFGVPWSRYLREVPALADGVRRIPESVGRLSDGVDAAGLREIVQRFFQGDTAHDLVIRQLLMLCIWHDAVVEGRRPGRRSVVSA